MSTGDKFKVHSLAAAKREPDNRTRRYPVRVTRVDPRVLRVAMRLAKGDRKRLRFPGDGSVIVIN